MRGTLPATSWAAPSPHRPAAQPHGASSPLRQPGGLLLPVNHRRARRRGRHRGSKLGGTPGTAGLYPPGRRLGSHALVSPARAVLTGGPRRIKGIFGRCPAPRILQAPCPSVCGSLLGGRCPLQPQNTGKCPCRGQGNYKASLGPTCLGGSRMRRPLDQQTGPSTVPHPRSSWRLWLPPSADMTCAAWLPATPQLWVRV